MSGHFKKFGKLFAALTLFLFVLSFALPAHAVESSWWDTIGTVAGGGAPAAGVMIANRISELSPTQAFVNAITTIIQNVLYAIISFDAWLLGLSGLFFETVMQYTVVNMKTHIDQLDAINYGWVLFRDLGNLCFIFILVYIAIVTVLGIEGYDTKRAIRNIIIIGLLVNFSLFFTKFFIDISNVLSISFYNLAAGNKGISDSIMTSLNLQKLFGPDAFNASLVTGDVGQRIAAMFTFTAGAVFFMICVFFTFVFAATLFVIRYLALVFIMIVSPLAFFCFVLPSTRKYFDSWKNLLIGQLIFAPMYMFLIFLVIKYLLPTILGSGFTTVAITSSQNLGRATSTAAGIGSIGTMLFGFIVSIGFLVGAAILATKVAASSGGIVGAAVTRVSNFVSPQRAMRKAGELAGAATLSAARGTARATSTLAGAPVRATSAAIARQGRNRLGKAFEDRMKEGSASREGLNQMLASNNPLARAYARRSIAAQTKLSQGTYDIRNVKPAAKLLSLGGGLNIGKGSDKNYRQIVNDIKEKHSKDVKNAGGASAETVQELAKYQGDLGKFEEDRRNAEIALAAAVSSKDTEGQKAARRSLLKADEDIKDTNKKIGTTEKKRAAEVRAQRLVRLKSLRDNSGYGATALLTRGTSSYLAPQGAFDELVAEFSKPPKVDKAEVEKAELEDIQTRLKDAIKEKDTAWQDQVKNIFLNEVKSGNISKLSGDVFVESKKDEATGKTTFTPRKEVIEMLTRDQSAALLKKNTFSENQKQVFRDALKAKDDREASERDNTPGGGSGTGSNPQANPIVATFTGGTPQNNQTNPAQPASTTARTGSATPPPLPTTAGTTNTGATTTKTVPVTHVASSTQSGPAAQAAARVTGSTPTSSNAPTTGTPGFKQMREDAVRAQADKLGVVQTSSTGQKSSDVAVAAYTAGPQAAPATPKAEPAVVLGDQKPKSPEVYKLQEEVEKELAGVETEKNLKQIQSLNENDHVNTQYEYGIKYNGTTRPGAVISDQEISSLKTEERRKAIAALRGLPENTPWTKLREQPAPTEIDGGQTKKDTAGFFPNSQGKLNRPDNTNS
jgi:type IV secretory pathway VirB6-like protein